MRQASSAFDDLLGDFSAPAPLAPLNSGSAPLAPASAQLPSAAEVQGYSAGKLKAFLDAQRVDHRACVEKSELLALALKALGLQPSSAAPLQPSAAPSGPLQWRPSLSASSAPASAIEQGLAALGNAFDATGFSALGGEAKTSVDHEMAYRAAGFGGGGGSGSGGSGGAAGFFAAASRISLAQLSVPTLPQAKLAVRVPRALAAPVVRELPWSALPEWHTALPPGVAGVLASAPGAAATAEGGTPAPLAPHGDLPPAARACLPFLGHALVGVRRLWEVPLREDASAEESLVALVEAARGCGLDPTHSAPGLLLLAQRISVPAGAWSTFVGSPSCARAPPPPVEWGASSLQPTVYAYPGLGSGAGVRGGSSGGVMGLLGARKLYVNSLLVALGTRPGRVGGRALLIATARFVPPSGASAEGAGEGPQAASLYGRLCKRESILGAPGAALAGAAAPAAAAAAATTAALMAELSSTGTGVTCVLLPPREGAAMSYREDRRQGGARGRAATATATAAAAAAAAAPLAGDMDDIFGAGSSSSSAASGGRERAASSQSSGPLAAPAASPLAALLHVPQLHPQHLPAMATCPGISGPAACAAPEDCDVVVGTAEANAVHAHFDDGSELAESLGQHDWSALRVSFVKTELRSELSGAGGGGGGGGGSGASGARFPRPPPPRHWRAVFPH